MEVGPTPLSGKPRKPTHSQVSHAEIVKPKPKTKKPAVQGNAVQRNNGHR
jgi:hypothetical protein